MARSTNNRLMQQDESFLSPAPSISSSTSSVVSRWNTYQYEDPKVEVEKYNCGDATPGRPLRFLSPLVLQKQHKAKAKASKSSNNVKSKKKKKKGKSLPMLGGGAVGSCSFPVSSSTTTSPSTPPVKQQVVPSLPFVPLVRGKLSTTRSCTNNNYDESQDRPPSTPRRIISPTTPNISTTTTTVTSRRKSTGSSIYGDDDDDGSTVISTTCTYCEDVNNPEEEEPYPMIQSPGVYSIRQKQQQRSSTNVVDSHQPQQTHAQSGGGATTPSTLVSPPPSLSSGSMKSQKTTTTTTTTQSSSSGSASSEDSGKDAATTIQSPSLRSHSRLASMKSQKSSQKGNHNRLPSLPPSGNSSDNMKVNKEKSNEASKKDSTVPSTTNSTRGGVGQDRPPSTPRRLLLVGGSSDDRVRVTPIATKSLPPCPTSGRGVTRSVITCDGSQDRPPSTPRRRNLLSPTPLGNHSSVGSCTGNINQDSKEDDDERTKYGYGDGSPDVIVPEHSASTPVATPRGECVFNTPTFSIQQAPVQSLPPMPILRTPSSITSKYATSSSSDESTPEQDDKPPSTPRRNISPGDDERRKVRRWKSDYGPRSLNLNGAKTASAASSSSNDDHNPKCPMRVKSPGVNSPGIVSTPQQQQHPHKNRRSNRRQKNKRSSAMESFIESLLSPETPSNNNVISIKLPLDRKSPNSLSSEESLNLQESTVPLKLASYESGSTTGSSNSEGSCLSLTHSSDESIDIDDLMFGGGNSNRKTTTKDNNNRCSDNNERSPEDDDYYGYGDAAPDVATNRSITTTGIAAKAMHTNGGRSSSMKGHNPPRLAGYPTPSAKNVVKLPGSRKKVTRSRWVTISDQTQVYEISPMMSKTAKADLWYQKKDLFERKLKIRDILRMAEEIQEQHQIEGIDSTRHRDTKDPAQQYSRAMEEMNDSFCMRGIEDHMKNESMKRDREQRELYEQLFATQRVQQQHELHDSFQLATFSERISADSRHRAIQRAITDALEVEMEERDDYRKLKHDQVKGNRGNGSYRHRRCSMI